MPAFRTRSGRTRAITVGALLLVVLVGVLMWFANPNYLKFNGFEIHGGPVVVNRASNPRVLFLTSHWETRSTTVGRYAWSANNYGQLHWDVFALDGTSLSQVWTSRLSTERHAERNIEAAILGLAHNTLWVVTDGLIGISLDNGAVITDGEKIEQLNPQLQGIMPTTRRQVYFDDGLVLIAADGNRWRIDPATFRATPDSAMTPVKTSVLGVPQSRVTDSLNVLPIAMTNQPHVYKSRAYVIGDTWYGMMHPSEVDLQKRDSHSQNFSTGLRYRLWSSPLRDTLDRMRQPAKLPLDFAPLPASPEFLYGSLLTVPDRNGRRGVVGIANPTRFILLHQDRIDNAAVQILSCIALDGKVCWNAPLKMNTVTGFSMLTKGEQKEWAIIVTGESGPREGDKLVDDSGDNLPLIDRVNVADGTVLQFRFADVDLRKLASELTPYRVKK